MSIIIQYFYYAISKYKLKRDKYISQNAFGGTPILTNPLDLLVGLSQNSKTVM